MPFLTSGGGGGGGGCCPLLVDSAGGGGGGDAVHFWPIQSVRCPPSRPIQSFNQRAEGAELLLQGGGHAPPPPGDALDTHMLRNNLTLTQNFIAFL